MNNDIILHGVDRKDWLKGDISIPIRLESGDWTPYRCNYQPQKFKFDTNECAQLSTINNCETQCNYLKATGQFSEEALKWFKDNDYFDENGLFDFSERFTAILAGCSILGSSQWWAWQAINKYGLLAWNDFHYTLEESQKFNSQVDMCNDFYNKSKITQAMLNKAAESKKYLQFAYEWVINNGKAVDGSAKDTLESHLKYAPVGVGVPICSYNDWNSGTPKACSIGTAHHAVMLYRKDTKNNYIIWDHYNPAVKTLPPDYDIFLAIKGIVTPAPVNRFKHTFYINMQRGSAGPEVVKLQTALIELGFDIPAITKEKYPKGYYGVETQKAVFDFQRKYVATDLWSQIWIAVWEGMGRYCHAYTRAALNKIFS